jgi:hypothetical protein
VSFRAQDARFLADDFLSGKAGQGGEGVIDGQDALLGVGDHDAFGSAVEDHRRQPQTFFGALAGGDVGGLETETGDRTVVVEKRKAHGKEMAIATGQRQRLFALDFPCADASLRVSLSRNRSHTASGKSCRSVLPIACPASNPKVCSNLGLANW